MARLLLGNSRGRRQGCCWLPIMGCCPIGVGAGSVLCVVASCRLCLGQMGEEGAEMVMASSVVRATVRAVSKRKIQATRAALTLTPSAAQKIKHLLKDKPEHVGVKVGVRTRGCNGLSYTLEYTKSKGDSDEEVVQDGIRIFIEKKAQLTLLGTEMDYVEDKLFSEFVFSNPNIKGTCGCGESFNV
ncbi:iron-sulfur cluster assembly 1 homolog, mitochondrial-like isoform X2 [Falco naumanni]|uniref:iron-sulfur cluster assembly 1 homolog, mitochondrial-like isoform X1 n=1 Tax=Falco naumanni TaxID=148594 RepID=UPI001ADDE8BA|nr:iron-sulfur cluster assembly 1 homolog, mitochondrial-like isoform X1 [Falco naumanni]XP_040434504.1 iron-sulfur cluster assembly 1 homolog, mitochondrial-like isoform X2 [Falco naumanni]